MGETFILDIMRSALYTVIIVSAPPLICGLAVGLLVSIFQTVTSIQEATLTFVPKILAVMLSLVVFGSFMGSTLKEFTLDLFSRLPDLMTL